MSKSWMYFSQWRSSRTRQQYCRSESLFLRMDQWSKTTLHLKRDQDSMQYGELLSYCGSRLVKFVLWILINFKDTFETMFNILFQLVFSTYSKWNSDSRERDRVESYIPPVHVSTTVDDIAGRLHDTQANKSRNQIKRNPRRKGVTRCVLRSQNSRKIWWMMKFPLQGGSHASSSHEASLEQTTKRREDLGKHSVLTHFPKDRNREICKGTNITKAPCRRRNSGAVPRAENFGDLITEDQKVFCDNCESRKKNTNMQLWCRT